MKFYFTNNTAWQIAVVDGGSVPTATIYHPLPIHDRLTIFQEAGSFLEDAGRCHRLPDDNITPVKL